MLIDDPSQITDPNTVIGYWNNEQNQNPPFYLSNRFLSAQEIDGDTTSMYIGHSNTPHGLSLSTDDTVPPREQSNDGFSTDSYRLIPFSNSKMFDEHRMNAIRNALALHSNDPAFVQSLSRSEMDDDVTLLNDAQFTREKLTLDAVLHNGIHINDARLQRDINYHAKTWQYIKTSTPWGTKDSEPITNLQDAVKYETDHHNNVTEKIAIMNDHTWDELFKSGQIINTLTPNHSDNDLNVALSSNSATNLVKSDTGLQFLVYNKGDANGRFIPDGKVILVPSTNIGRMAWTQTNEAQGLLESGSARVANTGDGVTVTTYRQIEPVGTIMVVSMRCLPVIDQEPNILIMDVNGNGSSSKGSGYTVLPESGSDNSSTAASPSTRPVSTTKPTTGNSNGGNSKSGNTKKSSK